MSEEGPHVTVVIPTRDRWELLRRALRSALAQRDVGVEAIVVDDASDTEPDEETRSILERASVIRLDRHGGVAAARNAGIRLAGGEWTAFLDDDDVWAPAKVSTVIGAIQDGIADFGYSRSMTRCAHCGSMRLRLWRGWFASSFEATWSPAGDPA